MPTLSFLKFLPSPKHEHRLLGLTLISWHIILWWGPLYPWLSQIGLFIYFCLFLLWQPIWAKPTHLEFKYLVLLSVGILCLILFLNPWLLLCWQLTWIGVLAGRDLAKTNDRVVNLVAIIFLILELFIVNIHQLFISPQVIFIDDLVQDSFRYGLLILPLSFFAVTADDTLEHRYHIDFTHSIIFSLLITVLALGSLVLMYHGQFDYPVALFLITLGLLLFIFISSWLGIILTGETGMEPLWSRHLFSLGDSFEQWLDNLAQPNNYKNLTPEEFLRSGFTQLTNLPWISGVAWHSLYDHDLLGHSDQYQKDIIVQSIEAKIYSPYRISGSHYFQVKILIQLLEYFHQAKRREAAFAQQAHLQAIHEAGAKLTHDIKNLLQSLHAITSVIETHPSDQFGETQRLLQGQMPHLTQRLKRTLDKLQKPAEFSYSHIPVSLWWDNLKARYRKSDIEFTSQTASDSVLIPEDLFDNVSENLIQNALMKRKREPSLQIDVSLQIDDKHNLKLTVGDDGSMIPKEIYQNLLTKPVTSKDGFGIGLYQAVKQLANTGYRLSILKNSPGQVCFQLANTEIAEV